VRSNIKKGKDNKCILVLNPIKKTGFLSKQENFGFACLVLPEHPFQGSWKGFKEPEMFYF
jgi:hypothetical protein